MPHVYCWAQLPSLRELRVVRQVHLQETRGPLLRGGLEKLLVEDDGAEGVPLPYEFLRAFYRLLNLRFKKRKKNASSAVASTKKKDFDQN